MQAGDRIMVYDSPGHPLAHYLYATVITPSDAGALVLVDHPGNPSHGMQRFYKNEKILRAGDARRMRDETKAKLAVERDGATIKSLREQIANHEFIAGELSE